MALGVAVGGSTVGDVVAATGSVGCVVGTMALAVGGTLGEASSVVVGRGVSVAVGCVVVVAATMVGGSMTANGVRGGGSSGRSKALTSERTAGISTPTPPTRTSRHTTPIKTRIDTLSATHR